MKASQWLISRCFRSRAGHTVMTLVSVAVLPPTATAKVDETVVTFPAYPDGGTGVDWSVSVRKTGQPGSRTFELHSTAPQRENGPSSRTITESETLPRVATANPLFDALFAQAVAEARTNSVSAIQDEAYGTQPIVCACFETGEKWHYVWTRDLSYALDLGLAGFDPERAATSLLFKTSDFRPGVAVPTGIPADSLQIIQDTGSGGSWPVSTDRTSWALGAERTLANLDGAQRSQFATKALAALKGTLEADRIAAFDARDGLYGGEHSFLDWREQTYAAWITDNLSAMAQSKALSTNVTHYRAMRLAERLALEAGDEVAAKRYGGWADDLARAIDTAFWDPGAGLYATYLTADLNPRRVQKFDLLGNALAIVSGLADDQRARQILSQYPVAPFGPPVVWPQAPNMFVYHNRAQWPFVTAYALKAASRAGHVMAADRAASALMRGAALNLSNMENLEWLTGLGQFDDGPQINSRRQLWSVGGYLGFAIGTIFGWQPEFDGVHVKPFLTSAIRAQLGESSKAVLTGVQYLGRPVQIELALPPIGQPGGLHAVKEIRLNGKPLSQPITAAMLRQGTNKVVITFAPAKPGADTLTEVPIIPARSHDDARAFMPPTPQIASATRQGNQVSIMIADTVATALDLALYRDGKIVPGQRAGEALIDTAPLAATFSVCYSVVGTDKTSRLSSQPSQPYCLRGEGAQSITSADPRLTTNPPRDSESAAPLAIGRGTSLTVRDLRIPAAGRYAFSIRYSNTIYDHNTGITNAVKRLTLTSQSGVKRSAILQMPHIRPDGASMPWRRSMNIVFDLEPGNFTLQLDDFFNMSDLRSNVTYIGPGGRSGPVNEAVIDSISIDNVMN